MSSVHSLLLEVEARERRFLVTDEGIAPPPPRDIPSTLSVYGFLILEDELAVRVERSSRPRPGGTAYPLQPAVLIVGQGTGGGSFSQEVMTESRIAGELLLRCPFKLVRQRFERVYRSQRWFIDRYFWENDGLVLAKVASGREHELNLPPWCGTEVTSDRRYVETQLARLPYGSWKSTAS